MLNLSCEQNKERRYVEHDRGVQQSIAYRRNDRELATAKRRARDCVEFAPDRWPARSNGDEFVVRSFGNDSKLLKDEGPYTVNMTMKSCTSIYFRGLNTRIGGVKALCKHLHLTVIRFPREATLVKLRNVQTAHLPICICMQNAKVQLQIEETIEQNIQPSNCPNVVNFIDQPPLDLKQVGTMRAYSTPSLQTAISKNLSCNSIRNWRTRAQLWSMLE